MASVTHPAVSAEWIDHSLEYLTNEWSTIPTIAAEWSSWDEADRLDFVLEWPLREDRLLQLRRWRDGGSLTESQRRKHVDLERLIVRHRAALDRLLAE